ncbi:MAG: methionine sulfoxide reductase heme-binding subunit [Solirubrobacteraceae bacterium]|jgi:DMSO/TMAO reductase YedYZ heme-binding membrane subunit|nr:methionine sulfoxide reductase heme-binding subunit [Solirubrobacteraceae bacterium]
MTTVLATSGPTAMWYLTRGSGAVSLVLLTASVVLGVVDARRWKAPGWPRFVVDGLHRNLSLLAVVFVVVHVVTTVLDGFAPIGLLDAVVPFVTPYRPLWIGLGAISFDLLLALIVTSLLRARVGWSMWRAVHWLAYASWPLAVVHGLASGSDTNSAWMQLVTVACIAAVWLAAWTRAAEGLRGRPAGRGVAFTAIVAAPLALAVWLPRGPLGSGWANRAGTPARLLVAKGAAKPGSSAGASKAPTPALAIPFHSALSGTERETPQANGLVVVTLDLTLQGGSRGRLGIHIVGQPLQGGGVSMQQSSVTLGSGGDPGAYTGRIDSLTGQQMTASLTGGDGRPVQLRASFRIDSQSGAVTGDAAGARTGGGVG